MTWKKEADIFAKLMVILVTGFVIGVCISIISFNLTKDEVPHCEEDEFIYPADELRHPQYPEGNLTCFNFEVIEESG